MGERSGRKLFIIENHQRRALPSVPDTSETLLSWKPGGSVHDVAEFQTDLGKRKLTYVGVTMSLVILWHLLPHDFFSPKKRKMLKLLVGVEIQLEIFWDRVKFYLTLGAHLCGLLPGLVYIPSRVPCPLLSLFFL